MPSRSNERNDVAPLLPDAPELEEPDAPELDGEDDDELPDGDVEDEEPELPDGDEDDGEVAELLPLGLVLESLAANATLDTAETAKAKSTALFRTFMRSLLAEMGLP